LQNTQAHQFYNFLENQLNTDPNGYAYWGKIIARNRRRSVDVPKIQKVIEENRMNGRSTHLYISDFNHLWVASIVEARIDIGDDFKALDFYRDKKVEVWFKVVDFTLLEYGPAETARKLGELYIDNPHEELKIDGLSPFTTGVRFPVFVQDKANEMYFDSIENSKHGALLFRYNPAIANSSTSRRLLDNLNSYIFPHAIYSKIPYAAKTEIEEAEMDIMEKRGHSQCRNAFSYIKALELCLNDLVIGHIKRQGHGNHFYVKPETMPPKLFLDDNRPGLIPISKWQKNYSIKQLIYFVDRCEDSGNQYFKQAFAAHRPFVEFMTKDLIKFLEKYKIVEIRGILAHNDSNSIDERDAVTIRNLIMGLGCHGIIHQAYQAFYHRDLKAMIEIQGNYQKANFEELKGNSKQNNKSKKGKKAA
jgi:hypothetical protein